MASSLPTSPKRVLALNCAETLAISAAGGLAFGLGGVPAGYVSGSLTAVAAAGLIGRPTFVPAPLVRLVLFALGVVLGAAVTPATLTGVATWPLSIAMLALCMVALFAATSSYLRFVHGWDPLSALFASSPGALSQVIALSVGVQVNLPAIVIVQTMRVVFLAVGTPIALTAFGHVPSSANFLGGSVAIHSLPELAILIAACAATTFVFERIRFPGAAIFGSMAASAVLHGSGLIVGQLPAWLVIVTMLGVGAMTGSRFNGTTPRLLLRYITAAIGAFAVTMTVTIVFVVLLTTLLPFRIADVVLAFSPGAQDAMMILVLSLAGDPVYVGAHHVSRFIMVSSALPLLMRIFGGTTAKPPARTPDAAPDD